jgi:uncharacterized membrane protein YczE
VIWRFLKLNVGLTFFATGIWLGLQAHLGVGPWDVLAGGLSHHIDQTFGTTSILVSVVVLLLGLAVGVRPGVGTVMNVIVIGLVVDALLRLDLLDDLRSGSLLLRLVATAGCIGSVAIGSALYIGAHLGPGPRDGLMVAIVQRTGWPVGRSRAVLELSVLALGSALGGPVGLGTLAFAVGIGPAVQVAFSALRQTPVRRPLTEPV